MGGEDIVAYSVEYVGATSKKVCTLHHDYLEAVAAARDMDGQIYSLVKQIDAAPKGQEG